MQTENKKTKKRHHHDGSIYFHERDKKWVANISLGKEGGKRKRKEVSANTKGVAEKNLLELQTQSNPYSDFTPQSSLRAFIERFLEIRIKPNVNENTFLQAELLFNTHVFPHVGSMTIEAATKEHMQTLMTRLERMQVGGATRQRVYSRLRLAFKVAKRWRLLMKNPMLDIPKPTHGEREIVVLSPEEIADLLHAAESSRLYALYVLAVVTGARRSELLGLQWADWDEQKRTIKIRRSAIHAFGKLYINSKLKTKNAHRPIPLPKFANRVLQLHRKRMKYERYDGPWMFVGEVSHQIIQDVALRKSFKALLKRAGISKPITFHGLRHTSITTLLRLGVHPKVVAHRHGQSVKVTINTYSHLIPGDDQELASRFSKQYASLITSRRMQ